MGSLVAVLCKLLRSSPGGRVTQMLRLLSHALGLELSLHLESNLLQCLQSQRTLFMQPERPCAQWDTPKADALPKLVSHVDMRRSEVYLPVACLWQEQ